jgi:hypothetical protein
MNSGTVRYYVVYRGEREVLKKIFGKGAEVLLGSGSPDIHSYCAKALAAEAGIHYCRVWGEKQVFHRVLCNSDTRFTSGHRDFSETI